ncbi:hypothetical protein A3D66_00395 [Candidatus Kaiserbacteria bacterium RIFCSPHIGHO2_02_FULL_50_9]|uniref:Uncharacterized protein n=1 Tax=Candidatus Kaiserbacteria bacterium RIFCSPLOWO2_01_FULL_51_21 TaxID=1798508 RepID=A0A1F6ECE3_9BACT|nr:MAG: hypothetical protein A2761_00330 [Candidatus Kaiserbacteria bacterium RIFCSPHIGHO2_01_FULL_51_33]OGG63596.1 MAG: hypothetical protein A3D66_00395 [Candidatus Kaiserbacteria bacterium RIFCSPHIGHO2_02_FULL_50_9]OGG71349.1 MAG: hypothetical protein A3A35_00060 [Candidatus Kaiserbacteria bacterium RIFCSPLOWO2_01_FULL_51_21]
MHDLFGKGKLPLVAVLVLPFFVGVAYAAWNYVPNTQNLAALTEAQIQSVLSLLSAFGLDKTLLQNVEVSLRDGTPSSVATSTETTPPPKDSEGAPVGVPVPVSEIAPISGNSLIVSVSPTPAAGYVPVGTTYVHVASFVFDASGSSEDISFSSLKFLYTDNALFDPYNCAIFSGPEEFMTRYTKNYFNSDWVHPTGTGDYTFVLTTPFVVSKGTTRVAEIRCTTNLQATKGTGSFSWGLSEENGKATFTGVGAVSKEIITPKAVPSAGNVMTFNS